MKPILSILSLSLILFSCKSKSITLPAKDISGEKRYDAAIADNIGASGLDLFKATVVNTEKGKNVMISPLSVQIAMAMAANGAEDNTLKQLTTLYNISPSDMGKLNAHYADLMANMTGSSSTFQLSLSNALFHDPNRLAIKKSYTDLVEASYIPYTKALNFDNIPASTGEINKWVKDKTNGKIEKVLNDIDATEFLFLINALYMKADWDNAFSPSFTYESTFKLSDGSTEKVSFMRKDFSALVYDGSNEQAVILPLSDGQLKLALIMPKATKSAGIDAYIGSMNYALLKDVFAAKSKSYCSLSIPKLQLKSRYDMKAILKYMSITDPFDGNKANFKGIGNGNIILTRVLHDIFFKMDEKGVEGAAVTTIGVGVTSLPAPLTFNRPFVLAVYHPAKNAYLFLGKIENPNIAE